MKAKNNPLISIIIPVLKAKEHLSECLRSVINQTYKDLDIILIDEASTGHSPSLYQIFAKNDKRIRLFHTSEKGINHARNIGLRESKGELICFIDSNCWIEENTIETLCQMIRSYNADIAMCPHYLEKEGKQKLSHEVGKVMELNRKKAICELYEERLITHSFCEKLFQRSLFDDITFPEDYSTGDTEILCMLLFRAGRIVVCPDPLYHKHHSPDIYSQGISGEYRRFRSLDNQYKFMDESGFLINQRPKFIPAGVQLLKSLSRTPLTQEHQEIRQDITRRLNFYRKMPVSKIGVTNALLLYFLSTARYPQL